MTVPDPHIEQIRHMVLETYGGQRLQENTWPGAVMILLAEIDRLRTELAARGSIEPGTEERTILPATGNDHDMTETFMEVSHGEGNTDGDEIHVLIRSNDEEFAQGWFSLPDLLTALTGVKR